MDFQVDIAGRLANRKPKLMGILIIAWSTIVNRRPQRAVSSIICEAEGQSAFTGKNAATPEIKKIFQPLTSNITVQ